MTDYVKESRAFLAIAVTAEKVAKRMQTETDGDAATALLVLAKLGVEQRQKMDKALDEMIAEGLKTAKKECVEF